MKKEFGVKLLTLRKEKGMSQAEVAAYIGLTVAGYQNYETGRREAGYETIVKLANLFNVTTDYLLGRDTSEPETPLDEFAQRENLEALEKKLIEKYLLLNDRNRAAVMAFLRACVAESTPGNLNSTQTIELRYSTLAASAGTGNFLEDESIETREFLDTPESRRADIVIPVSGDSMEPMFEDGDELLVRLQPSVEPGEIGVFIMNNCGYVKRFEEDRLVSLNPDYDDIYPDAEVRCVGKVIGIAEPAEDQV